MGNYKKSDKLHCGIAIIFIVFSHVAFQNSFLGELLGRVGVFSFLFISGYGIAASYGIANIDLKRYALKRFERVVIPYWTVLSLDIIRIVMQGKIPIPDMVLAMNYFFIVFIPYDIISDAWFVPYILFWYLVYALVSLLPFKAENKVWALFGVPAVLFIASSAIVAYISGMFVNFNSLAFHHLYIPYAFAFPLGVYVALVDRRPARWTLTLAACVLRKVCVLDIPAACAGDTHADSCRSNTQLVDCMKFALSLKAKVLLVSLLIAATLLVNGNAQSSMDLQAHQGANYYKAGDYYTAMQKFDMKIRADPLSPSAWVNRALQGVRWGTIRAQ